MSTEAILFHDDSPSEKLLITFALPIVEQLRPRVRSWHFLWEPDLYLRFMWKSDEDAIEGERTLREAFENGRARGLFTEWRLNPYRGDAPMYGDEIWPKIEQDFMNGSELCGAIATLEADGRLTKSRDYQWARHVHIFSDQLYGRWHDEARLCALQARYRAYILKGGSPAHAEELGELVDLLDRALEKMSAIDRAERELLTRWKAAGRPDIVAMLNLPPDFHRDPGKTR